MALKPFEITYSPANWNAPAGGIASVWTTPYGGLHVQAPENLIGPQYTPAVNNFMFRNGALTSRPRFLRGFLPGPDGSNPILGLGSFLSPSFVWHTFAFTKNGMFQLLPQSRAIALAGGQPWVLVGGPQMTSVSFRVFQSILYYTSGNGHLSAWNGAAFAPITDVAFTGTVVPPPGAATTFGGLYLGELDNHLMLGFTTEVTNGVAATFPQRVRWSNNGFNPTTAAGAFGGNLGTIGATFDPSVNVNAGFTDFIDVPDMITGFMFIGRTGHIFRSNGITEVSPTGRGTVPFDFNHMWASERGIGNVYPDAIAQYGNFGGFVSTEDVYKATPQGISAIGGSARDAIIGDLALTTGVPSAAIVPNFQLGFTYMTYILMIPQGNSTRVYVYSFDENNWTSWTISQADLSTPNNCWTGDVAITGGGPVGPAGSGGGGGGGTTTGGGTGTPTAPTGGGVIGSGGGGGTRTLPGE